MIWFLHYFIYLLFKGFDSLFEQLDCRFEELDVNDKFNPFAGSHCRQWKS